MKIIIVDEKHGGTRSVTVKGWVRASLSICLLGLPVVLGYFGYQLAATRAGLFIDADETAQTWNDQLELQHQELTRVRAEASAQLQSMTQRVAMMQAQLLRLDALGARLTDVAELDDGEFDFSQPPALGGPDFPAGQGMAAPDFLGALDELTRQVESRRQQLEVLESLLQARDSASEAFLAGRPITKGWISSPFGRRIDPFNGNVAWHQGMDFATGKSGQDIVAVASGVVTFAGEKSGYGLMVKVNHGNGFETLYAHDSEITVNVGDVVRRGQVIALSGSTGRSTGPHVHFEVHRNGRVVDPASYIRRTVQ